MKKTYLVTLGILLVTALILGGHAKLAIAWEWPKVLSINTHPSGSPMYARTVAWGAVLEKDTGMKVRIAPEVLGSTRFKNIREGTYDICVEHSQGIAVALEGWGALATRDGGPFPLRILWNNVLIAGTAMVRGDSDIKTIHDLKPGLRFAIAPGPISVKVALAYSAWGGLKPEEVQIVEFGSKDAAIRAIMEGQADIVVALATAPKAFEFEESPHGIRWLELDPEKDPEGAVRYHKFMPVEFFGMAPPESVKSAQGISLARTPMLYIVQETTDPELTYHLAKWLDEKFDVYKDKHRGAATDMSIEALRKFLNAIPFPVHKGVIKYLKEKGMWTAADDKRQAYNIELVNRYIEAYKAAIAEADKKGIKVHPKNKEWMKLWAKHKKDIPIFKVMYEIP